MGRLLELASRCWQPVMRALVSYGSLWTPHVLPELLEQAAPRKSAFVPAMAAEPAESHPEKLTPGVPLSPEELSLQQRLYATRPEH